VSLIKLNRFDSEKLFYLATESDFYRTMKDDWLVINPDHVCSVTVAKYGTSSLRHGGSTFGDPIYVFLPVRISLVNGEIHEVLESLDSVLDLLAGETNRHYFNLGWTITRTEENPHCNTLVRRTAPRE